MKDFLILVLIFAATTTFAQSDKQMEPVKQVIESEDIKMEMKEAPETDLDKQLDKLEEAVEEELEFLEEETDDMKEEKEIEELQEEKEMKLIDKEKVKEKLEIESDSDLKPDEE